MTRLQGYVICTLVAVIAAQGAPSDDAAEFFLLTAIIFAFSGIFSARK
jgi:hypothetical protein